MRKETLTMYNGNKQKYKKPLPEIRILDRMNDAAKAWIKMTPKENSDTCPYCYEYEDWPDNVPMCRKIEEENNRMKKCEHKHNYLNCPIFKKEV